MSKHWNGRSWTRAEAYAPPIRWRRRRDRRALAAMVAGGVILGLAYAAFPFGGSGSADRAAPTAATPDIDPWRESRRSRAILEAQEGAPAPVRFAVAGTADPSAVVMIDGDTFRYRGEKIRIADIDTPEVRGRCAHETRLAAQATARMGVLLAQGPFEMQSIDRDEDRYGRKLRIVTRGGASLGDRLVSEGLARTWTGRRQPWC